MPKDALLHRGAVGAGIFLLVLFIYSPALHGTWLWDDGIEVADNAIIRDPAGLGRIWLGEGAVTYYPLKSTVHWLLWRVFADDPAGYHFCSIILHGMSAWLLWGVLSRLGLRHGWIGSIVFAVHPMAVESVAWIAELKNTLSLPPLLLSIRAFLDYDAGGRRRDLVRSTLLFLAALLCKTSVIMLPVVLLLFLWWKHGRIPTQRRFSLVPFFGAALALGLVTLWFEHDRAIGAAQVPVGNLQMRVARAGLALLFYFGKACWPVELMPIYPRWPVDPSALYQYLPWVGLMLAAGWLWRWRHGIARHVLLGAGFFVINLLPVLGFVGMGYMHAGFVADHFAYISLLGFAGGVTAMSEAAQTSLPVRWQRLGAATLVVLLALFTLLSRGHAANFQNAEVFWTYAVRLNPASVVAQNNLGNAHFAAQRNAAAANHFRAALQLEPENIGARINLGCALGALGRVDEAIREHAQVVAQVPGSAIAHNSLAGSLIDAGRLAEAERHLEIALLLDPRLAGAHNNRGIVYARQGDHRRAEASWLDALRLNPRLESARINLERARGAAAVARP